MNIAKLSAAPFYSHSECLCGNDDEYAGMF